MQHAEVATSLLNRGCNKKYTKADNPWSDGRAITIVHRQTFQEAVANGSIELPPTKEEVEAPIFLGGKSTKYSPRTVGIYGSKCFALEVTIPKGFTENDVQNIVTFFRCRLLTAGQTGKSGLMPQKSVMASSIGIITFKLTVVKKGSKTVFCYALQ